MGLSTVHFYVLPGPSLFALFGRPSLHTFSDTQVLSKAIGGNEGASIPCTLMVYVSVEFL